MLDLKTALVRSAPGVLVGAPTEINEPSVTIEVIEPDFDVPIPRLPPPPPLKPRTHRLSKKKSAVLADRVAKREVKKNRKVPPRNKRFCKVCVVSCNSAKTFYDHLNSRRHRIRVENKRSTPRCLECNRDFETHEHLKRHKNGAAHLKIVTKNP